MGFALGVDITLMEVKMSKTSKKIADLQQQLDSMGKRVKLLEMQNDIMSKRWAEFDGRVMGVVKGKVQVMVVDRLEAYKKGKKIKKDIDYISEVLGSENEA